MPTVTSYRNGTSAGVGGGNPSPKKRGAIRGWTPGAVRRHTQWLYSVDAPALDGFGVAVTLTMRDCPPTSDDFERMRIAWTRRVERAGATRLHWVIEWQHRGVPHIHAAIYWDQSSGQDAQFWGAVVAAHWLDVAAPYRAQITGQHWDEITGAEGWLQYLSKHAARGVAHYQRSGKPDGWEKTGRLWGKRGAWPVDPPMRYEMSAEAYWRYRRLVRSWRVANARSRPLTKKRTRGSVVGPARRMLSCPQRRLSAVRGVSDWVPEAVSLQLIALIASEGHVVGQKS